MPRKAKTARRTMTTMNVYLPRELHEKIAEKAKADRRTVSMIVIMALEKDLGTARA